MDEKMEAFRALIYIWLVQNVLLVITLFVLPQIEGFEPKFDGTFAAANLVFYMDIMIFLAFAVITLMYFDEGILSSILIIAGAVIFIYFTLIWRTAMGMIFPLSFLEPITSNYNPPAPQDGQLFGEISYVANLIIFANFGLLLFSVGMAVRSTKKGIKVAYILYGLGNVVGAIYIIALGLGIFMSSKVDYFCSQVFI